MEQEVAEKRTLSSSFSNLAGVTLLSAVLCGLGALDQYAKKTEFCSAVDGDGRAMVTLDRGGSLTISDKTTEGQSHSHIFRSKSFDLDKAKAVMYQYCESGEIPHSPDVSGEPQAGV